MHEAFGKELHFGLIKYVSAHFLGFLSGDIGKIHASFCNARDHHKIPSASTASF